MRVLSVEDQRDLKVLHTVSSSLESVDSATREIVNEMIKIAERGDTVGLSAVQLGYPIRVFVIDMFSGLFNITEDLKVISGHHSHNTRSLVCINPQIVSFSGETVTLFEGCLSVKSYGMVGIQRPGNVDLKYTDLAGNVCVIRTFNWLARCVQHEMDHLNGVLLANMLDNIKNKSAQSVSEEDFSSVHILLLDKNKQG
ncbi:formylmethionine deformylase [Anaplasma phagocytophilum str. MRK]|uniref:peptide deformylase n=1 Tax=Anaplasma phagocytophilum TaxID=948 RepID=UPI00053392DD|nr:peptide deformylase [Anaplasma phagocytophilum]KDB56097.1 formylmethionine deformylase [Anaplasma phagocytophilum str. MRK]